MQINGELTQVICQPRNDKTDDDNGNYDIMMMMIRMLEVYII